MVMSRPCESEFCSVPALLSSVASAKVRWSARCTNLFLVAEALPELVRSESDKSIGRKQATSAHCATSEDRASNDTRTLSPPQFIEQFEDSLVGDLLYAHSVGTIELDEVHPGRVQELR